MPEEIPERFKSPAEVAEIVRVQRVVESAMRAALQYLSAATAPAGAMVQTEIAQVLQSANCESPEGCIVAAGPASAEPHFSGEGAVATGVPVVIDIYPRDTATGWWADMTRTVCLGKPPAELERMYEAVENAIEVAERLIAPGVACATVYDAVHDYFTNCGFATSGTGREFRFAEGFVHSVGHGLGQSVHEAPAINARSGHTIELGDVITIEPGLYYHHIGGVRLENLYYVGENGLELLTDFPLELELSLTS